MNITKFRFYFYDPTLILPYDRGERNRFLFCNLLFSPVTGETQRGLNE